MRLLISLISLFASVVLLQLAIGSVGPLDQLSGVVLGFSTTQIGLIGSAHFVGFFIGCWWTPRLMGNIGASRAFAVFTAIGAIGMLAHMMLVSVVAWALFRVLIGLCVAGAYTVIEAWLNEKATNQNRGRVTGTYRIVDLGASLCAQRNLIGRVALELACVFENNDAVTCQGNFMEQRIGERCLSGSGASDNEQAFTRLNTFS